MEKKETGDFQGVRILVAEDNKVNQIVIRALLESRGLVPKITNNGLEALNALETSDFDLILMDVQMPEMDGYEAAGAIREFESRKMNTHFPGVRNRTPIIAMTAHVMPGERQKCLDAGMDDCLEKPVEPEQMFAVLKNYIKTGDSDLREAENTKGLYQNKMLQTLRVSGQENCTSCFFANPEIGNIPAQTAMPNPQPIDSAAGIRRLGGNADLYRKLLTAFSEDYAAAADFVRENLEKGNTEKAGQLVHSLKGAAGNMGAADLYRAADELESCIREHPGRKIGETAAYARILPLFASALHQLRTFVKYMNTLPDEKSAPVYEKNGRTPEHLSELKNLLKELGEFLKDGDSEAAESLKKLKPVLRDSGMEDLMSRMEAQLFDFDFEKAIETLDVMVMMLEGD
ncbi:MAG: response regulator [Desulfococcaceae bacterium]